MIRVTKPARAPAVLSNKGQTRRRADCAAFSRHSADYRAGRRSFTFDSKIYGHKTVREALIRAQHDKCFLCESKITHVAYGDVEHFRPKAGYRQTATDDLHKPGYYWLAYEWGNLFFACQLCNQQFKKNLFPLADPSARATSHKDDLEGEEPLFVDPSADDPELFISFRREVPFPVKGDPRARATITELGLDRLKLNERRLELYEMLKTLYEIARMKPPLPESGEARRLLDRAAEDSAEYAGMARAALAAKFQLLS